MHVTAERNAVNVLRSFEECHNVTWPICVPATTDESGVVPRDLQRDTEMSLLTVVATIRRGGWVGVKQTRSEIVANDRG